MIVELRLFLDNLACARPDADMINDLASDLADWSSRLRSVSVDEAGQVYARRGDLVGRGQVTWPFLTFTRCDERSLEAEVRFSRYFLGRNGVAHGGVVLLIFDEVAGRMAHVGDRPVARTAFLHADFRAPAPIDEDLTVTATITREEGRKRFISLRLLHGNILLTEAEALMVALRPGQR